MLFDERLFPVKRNRMKVEVKRNSALKPNGGHCLKPKLHHLRIAARINPATVLRQKGTLGNHVDPGKECDTLVEDFRHDVA